MSARHKSAAPAVAPEQRHIHEPTGITIREWRGSFGDRSWRLFNGPAKETLSLLPEQSVDCCITSPPYFWLRDYKIKGQMGLEDTIDAYVVALTDVMTEVFRLLTAQGVLFLNLGDTYYSGRGESQGVDKKSSKRRFGLRAVDKSGGLGIGLQKKSIIGVPWRVAIKMCQQNWILRAPIVWHRTSNLTESAKDRPSRGYEYIFMFVKSRSYFFQKAALPRKGSSENVWYIPARPKSNGRLDTAPYPEELVEQCLKIGCKARGTVLDPFVGSGTTMRVALRNEHSAIGIDLNRKFCDYVRKDLVSLNGALL
jgi:DNA modification methylase